MTDHGTAGNHGQPVRSEASCRVTGTNASHGRALSSASVPLSNRRLQAHVRLHPLCQYQLASDLLMRSLPWARSLSARQSSRDKSRRDGLVACVDLSTKTSNCLSQAKLWSMLLIRSLLQLVGRALHDPMMTLCEYFCILLRMPPETLIIYIAIRITTLPLLPILCRNNIVLPPVSTPPYIHSPPLLSCCKLSKPSASSSSTRLYKLASDCVCLFSFFRPISCLPLRNYQWILSAELLYPSGVTCLGYIRDH